jgi:RNA polymerase sigma-B factor
MSIETRAVPVAYGENLDEIAEQYAFDRARLGDRENQRLRDQLITQLLPFAGRLAGRYRGSREPLADLEQVARVGLVKAVDRYDPGRGSFTAFAVATVTGELKRYFRDSTWGVHVPRRLQELALRVAKEEGALTAELGRRPTDREVARRCRVNLEDVTDARRSAAGYISVPFSVPTGESGRELGDQFGEADHAVELVPDQVTLRELLGRLPARERHILMERFYGNRSQAEIGADLGISQMHVSRLLSRTLEWLRAALLTDHSPAWPRRALGRIIVTIRREPSGALRIFVAGEIDRDNADRLRQMLAGPIRRARAGSRLVVDLAGVPLIDAAGLAVLSNACQAARVRHVTVTVARMQPLVGRLVATAHLPGVRSRSVP